jgi:NAD(P)-dependent dehydrogenase (short-subunit alcohol dehydrogenase family)
MQDLSGKVAVVTGGGNGIGRGLCRGFAAERMAVAVADVDVAAAEETARELRGRGAKAIAVRTDVSDRKSVEDLAARVERELGPAHVVCNNAGVLTTGELLAQTEGEWRWIVGVNLMGVVHGSHVFAPRLVARGAGHIVNTASVGGFLASAQMDIYTTTKYAVVGFSESLRQALADKGVGVSILCPGPILTKLASSDRLRPADVGAAGGTATGLAPFIEGGMDPDAVAPMVLRGIRANAEYIFTHAQFRGAIEARFQRVLAAFDGVPPGPRPDR